MSSSGLVHNDTFKFDGTNYILWRNRMLCKLRALCPYIERFLDVGFSPPVDPQNLSLEDEKNLHLEAQVYNEFLRSMNFTVYGFLIDLKCKSSHKMWTKLEERYGGSTSLEIDYLSKGLSSPSHLEELQVASTAGCEESSIPSTSPKCDLSQGNVAVSGEIICDDDIVLYTDDSYSTNANGVDRLDLNSSCNKFFTHSCVKGPCISLLECA